MPGSAHEIALSSSTLVLVLLGGAHRRGHHRSSADDQGKLDAVRGAREFVGTGVGAAVARAFRRPSRSAPGPVVHRPGLFDSAVARRPRPLRPPPRRPPRRLRRRRARNQAEAQADAEADRQADADAQPDADAATASPTCAEPPGKPGPTNTGVPPGTKLTVVHGTVT